MARKERMDETAALRLVGAEYGIDFTDFDGGVARVPVLGADEDNSGAIRELLSQADGSPNIRSDVEWVAAHVSLVGVLVSEAPSAFAWNLLEWAQESVFNRTAFYTNFVKALMPSKAKSDVDEERRVRENSSNAMELVERLQTTLRHVDGSVVRTHQQDP